MRTKEQISERNKRSYQKYKERIKSTRIANRAVHTDYVRKSTFQTLTNAARLRAKKKGIECTINYIDIETMWNQQNGLCYYSGLPMDKEPGRGKGKVNINKVSIDRLVSAKGYTLDNIVLCRYIVNRAKCNFLKEDFINMCRSVVANSGLNIHSTSNHHPQIELLPK